MPIHSHSHGHHGHHHSSSGASQAALVQQAAMYNQMIAESKDSIYVVRPLGSDSMCGFPCFCCKGGSVQCNFNRSFLPDELNGIVSHADYSLMINEIDQVLKDTHVPMLPCVFTHFCLPFSPICFMYYCKSQRLQRIQAILDNYNTRLVERGYYWEGIPLDVVGFAHLKINHTAAQAYTRNHPGTGATASASASAPPMPGQYVSMTPMVVAQPVSVTAHEMDRCVPTKREY